MDAAPANPPAGEPAGAMEIPPLQAADLKALAQVAGGVAPALHDLLAVVTGRASRLLDADATDAPTRESLLEIYTAGEKAVGLIRQLLLFSGRQQLQAQALDLNALVQDTRSALDRLLGAGVAVDLRLAPDLPTVPGDVSMLEHALLGLAANARDAMPRGGRLVVATGAVTLTAADAASFPGGRAGNFVVLGVSDTGGGIAPEILPRIFEPFFTTKPAGRSAGLGLATIFGIVQQHQGWVAVTSRVGVGSEFKIFLPVAAADPSSPPPPSRDSRAGPGRETILLVEDDESVRMFTAATLQETGYRVLQAGTAADALETWKWHGSRIGLLVTDMVLDNDIGGLELAGRFRAEKPGLGVICTSGHTPETMARSAPLPDGYHFLPKPCRPQALLRVVRAVLDAGPPARDPARPAGP